MEPGMGDGWHRCERCMILNGAWYRVVMQNAHRDVVLAINSNQLRGGGGGHGIPRGANATGVQRRQGGLAPREFEGGDDRHDRVKGTGLRQRRVASAIRRGQHNGAHPLQLGGRGGTGCWG